MRRTWPALFPVVLSLAGLSCSAPAPTEPLGLNVRWGLSEPSVLPATVTDIILYICYEDEEQCDRNQCSVAALTGVSPSGGSCRPMEGTEDFMERPVLVRRDLRTDVPVRFTVVGADDAGAYRFLGQAGPIVLGEGQRRQVDLTMYPLGASTDTDEGLTRLMPTASLLPDGRVLIAGGFDTIGEAPCAPERSLPAESICYDLVASDQAVAFDVTTSTATPIRGAMLAARGGHTATTLPDGRVLLAGGAPRATVAFSPQGDPMSGRFLVQFFPQLEDGSDGALANFELFDAYLDGAADDPERDGDPGRGRFIGTSGTASPGSLNAPRFLHAAAAIPAEPSQVLLAGGLGGGESSYELFDADRAGGFGVYAGGGALTTARPLPGAVGVGDLVWIFGGRLAQSNVELAEIWSPSGDRNGSVAPASEATEFPALSAGMAVDEPRFSLLSPTVTSVDEGGRPLVVGWYGTQCAPAMTETPVFFDPGGAGTVLCSPPVGGSRTSFTVSMSGVTTPTEVTPRSFGAAVRLWRRPVPDVPYVAERSGEVALTGGIANVAFSGQGGIQVFTGGVTGTGEALRDSSLSVSLLTQRFLHASVAIPGGGIVTAGGASFATRRLAPTPQIEVAYIPNGR